MHLGFDCLGFTTVMSDSLKLILDTMLEKGVKNISVCLSCKFYIISLNSEI